MQKARVCLYNAFGMGINGHATPYAPVARAAALALDGEVAGGATLFLDGRRTTIGGACLANAALFHGRAQEDTCGAAHFGTILIPLLTAMIEARGYPLSRLIPALVAGYEAGGVLEKALSGKTTPGGFRSSAMLRHHRRERRGRQAHGAVRRANHGGARQRGVVRRRRAAIVRRRHRRVALSGWRGRAQRLGRRRIGARRLGVCAATPSRAKLALLALSRAVDLDRNLAASLGQDWAILRVAFKPFPVCAFNQTPVTGALALREQLRAAPARVRVRMNPYETGYAGMDAVGPFSTISGTLMSIPFCIATTLVHGAPTTRHMTTYDDAAVNDLVNRVELVTDPSIPTLSAVIEAETADGAKLVREQPMTAADYSYDLPTLSAMLRRIGNEEGVPMSAFDRLERFVERLPQGAIDDAISVFTLAPSQARAA